MSYFGSIQGIETLIPLETLRKECPELGLPEFVWFSRRCNGGCNVGENVIQCEHEC